MQTSKLSKQRNALGRFLLQFSRILETRALSALPACNTWSVKHEVLRQKMLAIWMLPDLKAFHMYLVSMCRARSQELIVTFFWILFILNGMKVYWLTLLADNIFGSQSEGRCFDCLASYLLEVLGKYLFSNSSTTRYMQLFIYMNTIRKFKPI